MTHCKYTCCCCWHIQVGFLQNCKSCNAACFRTVSMATAVCSTHFRATVMELWMSKSLWTSQAVWTSQCRSSAMCGRCSAPQKPPRWVSNSQSSSSSSSGAPSPHSGCLPVSPPPAASLEPPGPMVGVYQSVLLLQLQRSPHPHIVCHPVTPLPPTSPHFSRRWKVSKSLLSL